MNRNIHRPLAYMLVLCFLLISVSSYSANSLTDSCSLHEVQLTKSTAEGKQIVQLVIEEKEGEKDLEKSLVEQAVVNIVIVPAALCQTDVEIRNTDLHRLSKALSLYLIYRSLII